MDPEDDLDQPDVAQIQQPQPLPVPPRPQPPPQPPPIPEPFTQADTLRLQRLQQGLSAAQQQIDSGELSPQDGNALKQQILRLQQPLQQRQQQAKTQAQAEQAQQLMHASALQESIEQQHALSQANYFPRTVVRYRDEESGKLAHFYQNKRGEWDQIDFPDEGEDLPSSSIEQPQSMLASLSGSQAAATKPPPPANPEEMRQPEPNQAGGSSGGSFEPQPEDLDEDNPPMVQRLGIRPEQTRNLVFPGWSRDGKTFTPSTAPPPPNATPAQLKVYQARKAGSAVDFTDWAQARSDAARAAQPQAAGKTPALPALPEARTVTPHERAQYERDLIAQHPAPQPPPPGSPLQQVQQYQRQFANWQQQARAAVDQWENHQNITYRAQNAGVRNAMLQEWIAGVREQRSKALEDQREQNRIAASDRIAQRQQQQKSAEQSEQQVRQTYRHHLDKMMADPYWSPKSRTDQPAFDAELQRRIGAESTYAAAHKPAPKPSQTSGEPRGSPDTKGPQSPGSPLSTIPEAPAAAKVENRIGAEQQQKAFEELIGKLHATPPTHKPPEQRAKVPEPPKPTGERQGWWDVGPGPPF